MPVNGFSQWMLPEGHLCARHWSWDEREQKRQKSLCPHDAYILSGDGRANKWGKQLLKTSGVEYEGNRETRGGGGVPQSGGGGTVSCWCSGKTSVRRRRWTWAETWGRWKANQEEQNEWGESQRDPSLQASSVEWQTPTRLLTGQLTLAALMSHCVDLTGRMELSKSNLCELHFFLFYFLKT